MTIVVIVSAGVLSLYQQNMLKLYDMSLRCYYSRQAGMGAELVGQIGVSPAQLNPTLLIIAAICLSCV